MGDISELAKAGQEIGKASQEVAKTTSKAIDAGSDMGGFISRYISGPLEQASGILEDHLRYIREERRQRLLVRAEEFRIQQGLPLPDKPVPLKHAVPLFFHATLEEDDNLQDMWARLLINGTNESTGINIERPFIEILAQISFLEARILKAIYDLPFEKTQHGGVITENLPEYATVAENKPADKHKDPPHDIKLALANLARLGCIKLKDTWDGGEVFSDINPTIMGKEFVEACTSR